jgi:DtxR family Mn-dependent transcriptional regulator
VRVALEVLRHHRLLELFLAEQLGVPWDRVHDEAEVLEHVLSEELEELIAAKLGNPTRDPHGDPIPTRELEIEEARARRWPALAPGARGTFRARLDANPAMPPGSAVLAARDPPGDLLRDRRQAAVRRAVVRRFSTEVHGARRGAAAAMRVEVP